MILCIPAEHGVHEAAPVVDEKVPVALLQSCTALAPIVACNSIGVSMAWLSAAVPRTTAPIPASHCTTSLLPGKGIGIGIAIIKAIIIEHTSSNCNSNRAY